MTEQEKSEIIGRKTDAVKSSTGSLNSKGGADAYAKAYKIVWDKLPPWKRNVVTECIASKNTEDRIYNEFVKAVIALAEES